MKSIEGTIKKIIEHGLGKIPWCVLGSEGKCFQFSCLYSSIETYTIGQSYSLYEIAPLERLLIKKNKLLDEKILDKIYRNDNSKVLSYIVNWEKLGKLVLLLQIKTPFTKPEQVKETLDIIAKNRNLIFELFKGQETHNNKREYNSYG